MIFAPISPGVWYPYVYHKRLPLKTLQCYVREACSCHYRAVHPISLAGSNPQLFQHIPSCSHGQECVVRGLYAAGCAGFWSGWWSEELTWVLSLLGEYISCFLLIRTLWRKRGWNSKLLFCCFLVNYWCYGQMQMRKKLPWCGWAKASHFWIIIPLVF